MVLFVLLKGQPGQCGVEVEGLNKDVNFRKHMETWQFNINLDNEVWSLDKYPSEMLNILCKDCSGYRIVSTACFPTFTTQPGSGCVVWTLQNNDIDPYLPEYEPTVSDFENYNDYSD